MPEKKTVEIEIAFRDWVFGIKRRAIFDFRNRTELQSVAR